MFLDFASREHFIIPILFASLWIILGVIAYRKKGEYGAPWGLLYMQQEEERDKLNKKFLKQMAQENSSLSMSANYMGDINKLKAWQNHMQGLNMSDASTNIMH